MRCGWRLGDQCASCAALMRTHPGAVCAVSPTPAGPCTSPLRSPVSRSALRGTTPLRLTSPRLGRKPTSAVWLLGPRTLLPVSVPRAAMPRLAAAAAAEPPEEPAGVRPRLYGLRTVPDTLREWENETAAGWSVWRHSGSPLWAGESAPHAGISQSLPHQPPGEHAASFHTKLAHLLRQNEGKNANSPMLVLASTRAPPCCSRATARASACATLSRSDTLPTEARWVRCRKHVQSAPG